MYAVVWHTIYAPEFTILLGLVTFKYMCSYFIFEKRTERCCRIHEWHLKSPISKHINILQNPPYYTNLQLRIKKFRGGGGGWMYSQRQISIQTVSNNQLISKIPQQSQIRLPPSKIPGQGSGFNDGGSSTEGQSEGSVDPCRYPG